MLIVSLFFLSLLHLCISIGSFPSLCGLTVGLGSKAFYDSKLFTPAICTIQERSENQCTSQLKSLIDQVSMQQEKIVALEGTNTFKLAPPCDFFFLDVTITTQIRHFYGVTNCNACKTELITIYSSWHCLGYLLLN